MKTLREYMTEGQNHEAKRKEENRRMLKAGGQLCKLAEALSSEGEMEYEKAFEVVCEQNPEIAMAYFEGLRHRAHREKTYSQE